MASPHPLPVGYDYNLCTNISAFVFVIYPHTNTPILTNTSVKALSLEWELPDSYRQFHGLPRLPHPHPNTNTNIHLLQMPSHMHASTLPKQKLSLSPLMVIHLVSYVYRNAYNIPTKRVMFTSISSATISCLKVLV